MKNEELEPLFKGGVLVLIGLYLLYQLYVFMHAASLSPDEFTFISQAKDIPIFSDKPSINGYGYLFWILLKIFNNEYILRFIFYILFVSSPILIVSSFRTYEFKLLSFLLYLSFPYSFWIGKLIGPEILSLFFASLALFFMRKKGIYAGLYLGISSGIKITSIPLIFSLFFKGKIKILDFIFLGISFIIGFIIANPFNIASYIQDFLISKNLGTHLDTFSRMGYVMLGENYWLWDNVLNGPFSVFILNCYLLPPFLLLIFYGSFWWGIGTFFALLSTWIMVALSQFGFGWYWFGVAPLLMFSLVALENKSANVKGFLRIFIPAAILLIVVLNFYSNFQFSILQSAEKIRSIRAVDSNTLDCINDNILSYNPDEIISKVEFGLIIKNNSIPVQGNFESKVHPDKKTMIIIGSRMISNPYNINSMLEKTDSIYKYSICGDNFIFINKPSN